ncbi:hypothetical protein ACL9SP_01440 [Priestia flexa]|uniref:hypothetical protein n=1 Tax=Priestia flexa TaxID=86664 RepID=UPI0039B52F75
MKITIEEYLNQTQYTCRSLIDLINKIEADKMKIAPIKGLIPVHEKQAEMLAQKAEQTRETNKPKSLKIILDAVENRIIADKYLGQVVEVEKAYNDALFVENGPIQSVSQALLQIAKQGISLVHGKYKSDCNEAFKMKGKAIQPKYNVTLLDVIWEGRNQSIHYEEKSFYSNVEKCFNALLKMIINFVNHCKVMIMGKIKLMK